MRNKSWLPAAVGALVSVVVPMSSAWAANLVVNGDFSAGNTGFTSDYSYSPAAYGNNGDYYVLADYNGFKDHTTGSGNFLLGDGASNPNERVWAETISTVAGAAYTFSYFHTEFNGGPNAVLAFYLDGVQTGTPVAPTNGAWNLFFVSFNSGTATSHTLAIVDQTLGYSYNDFGIDDIALRGPAVPGVPEPASWAIMLVGLGAVGAAMRRRQSVGGASAQA